MSTSADLDWQAQAVCRTVDPELFYGDEVESDAARRLCAVCPVRVECLDVAFTRPERFGVWGGLSSNQRALLRNGHTKPPAPGPPQPPAPPKPKPPPPDPIQPLVTAVPQLPRERVELRRRVADMVGGVAEVVAAVADQYDVTPEQILSADLRRKKLTEPRQTVMYLSRRLLGLSLTAIGGAMRRDHTTVMHGVNQVDEAIREGRPPMGTVLTLLELWGITDLDVEAAS